MRCPAMEAIAGERCTLIYGVPTMFIAQLNHPEFPAYDYSSLRGGIMAGAPCPVEIMKRVMKEMHCAEITIVYGQTESSPVITGSKVDDSVERRVSTVGCVFPNTEVKLSHRDTGETVETGAEGEICTRGYLVMKGYDNDPEATREVLDEEGWLHTGDIAVMREDGYIHLTGRAKDVIIRGGENVYPKEVEDFLHTHPAIADVEVVGVPDAKARRGGAGVDQAAAGRVGHRGGDPRVLPRRDRPLQGPAVHPLHRHLPAHGDGQDAEVPDPRTGDRAARPPRRRTGHRVGVTPAAKCRSRHLFRTRR